MQKYPISSQSGDKPMAPTVSRLEDMAFAALLGERGILEIEVPPAYSSPKHQQEISSVLESMMRKKYFPNYC